MYPIMSLEPSSPSNIADYFLDGRIRGGHGHRVAVRTANGDTTYAELRARANQFANVFADMGAGPGERVMVALPDVPDFAAALFGAVKTGAAAVMANPRLPARQISELLRYVEPRAGVVHASRAEHFLRARRGVNGAPALLTVGEEADDPSEPAAAASTRRSREPKLSGRANDRSGAAVDAASPEFSNFASGPDDPAVLLFSGGTTSVPKAVVQGHASFVNSTERYAKGVLKVGPDDITLSVPKLYFGYATGSNLFFPMSVGASTVLFPERCTADEIFRQIARHRPTILVNVPTMVNQMTAHPDAAAQDLGCLRLATSAGEPLPRGLHERWNDTFGVELLDGLGTAEMWHVFISNRPGQVHLGTLGTPVPGFEVSLLDEQGREAAPGEPGRMRVRGGSLARGYWRRPEDTRSAFVGGWYVSGDMMTRDAEGRFAYRGRADDLLKVAGKWVSPAEVEDCLMECAEVKEAAVTGVETPDGLVVPEAFLVARSGTDAGAAAEAIRERLAERLQPYKHPRRLRFLDALPRTHLGKVDRGALRAADRGAPTSGARGAGAPA